MTRIIIATILLAALLAVFGAGCASPHGVPPLGGSPLPPSPFGIPASAGSPEHAKAWTPSKAAPAPSSTVSGTVRWNPSPTDTGYKVYHTPDLAQPMTVLGTTSGTNYQFSGLPFAAGFFHVTATNQWGESP